jgi:cyclophilin family peptidyl-prolyl cis-trans isomerase
VELVELLKAKDEYISQAAADTLREHPDPLAERPLLDLLSRKDLSPDVADTAMRALSALYETGRLPRPGADAAVILTPWLRLRRLDDTSPRLAALLKIEMPTPRHSQRRVPDLADVLRIRSARVFTSEGELRISLAPEEAPYTVWNFAELADRKYYDGLVFHRVVPDFVAQTGDPRGDGWGGPGYEIPDEINPLSYTRGTVGMALSGPDTGGSQWFVTLSDQFHLDGGYTAFGHVSYGMRVAEALAVGDRIERVVIERL